MTIVAIAAVCVVAGAAAFMQRQRTAAGSALSAAGLHVSGAHLADADGRFVQLRGVALTGLVQYAPDYPENPPITRGDLDEIAALGFNEVRLPVSWSSVEPARGRFSSADLARVATVVRWARADGLYVVIDGHFDRYNRLLDPGDEADGAPGWATVLPDGISLRACAQLIGSLSCQRDAWQSFWTDAQGVQDAYVRALVRVSRAVRGLPNVAGIELMNNPSTGFTPGRAFDRSELLPFYQRAIHALRADGEHRPLWLDEPAQSEQTGVYAGPLGAVVRGDSQLVFAPHDYVGVFTSKAWPAGGAAGLAGWFTGVLSDARGLGGLAPVIGEYGIGPGLTNDVWIQSVLRLADEARLGSTFWVWKQRPGFYDWPVVSVNGALRSDTMRAQILGEPHVDAVPGRLDSESYLPGGSLTVRMTSTRAGIATFWSGAVVRRGGINLLPRALVSVSIDGRAAPGVRRSPRSYANSAVALGGELVSVPVSRGTHTITLR